MKRGFTLVELSIALVIIGLLIGGILVGQSLIESAKVSRIVTDLGQYEVAIKQFKSKFRHYPGDSPYFSPPGAPDNRLFNGDGAYDLGSPCNGTLSNTEATQVWGHLSQAGMLNKTYASFSPIPTCNGVHPAPYGYTSYYGTSNAGVVAPYIEHDTEKYPIIVNKNSASGNLRLEFSTDVRYILPLENKMSATESYVETAIGLVNAYGLGNCYYSGDPYPCIDLPSDTAGVSVLFYYYVAHQ